MRVLGAGFKGSGKTLLAGLRWAIEQEYDIVNMSLSTTKRELGETSTSSPTRPTSSERC